jgi:hypothetical protein
MKVYFGRSRGEQTLGKITKLNPTKAKVETLETRGHNRPIGQLWNVPYDLMRPAEEGAAPLASTPKPVEPLQYSPFADEDNLILEAIAGVYGNLSPENLTCDGELSQTQVRQRYAELQRKLRGLCMALGREVTEDQIYAWEDQRSQYQKKKAV